jgi:hypothetical protein
VPFIINKIDLIPALKEFIILAGKIDKKYTYE